MIVSDDFRCFSVPLAVHSSQDKRNKFSRKRLNEDEGDITYINERNRVFNKKVRCAVACIYDDSKLTFVYRLPGITTSTRPRFGPALSVVPLFDLAVLHTFYILLHIGPGVLICCRCILLR